MGIGNKDYQTSLVEISFFKDKKILDVQCGAYHTFVKTLENGKEAYYCFGANDYGQLGIGNFENQLKPQKFEFKEKIAQIRLKEYSTFILTG